MRVVRRMWQYTDAHNAQVVREDMIRPDEVVGPFIDAYGEPPHLHLLTQVDEAGVQLEYVFEGVAADTDTVN